MLTGYILKRWNIIHMIRRQPTRQDQLFVVHLRSALYCKAVRQLPIINFYAFIENIRLKRIFFIHLRISILSCSNNARWYNCSCVRPEIIKSEIRKKTHYTIFHNLIVANKSRAFPVRAFDLGNEKSSIVLRSFSASISYT